MGLIETRFVVSCEAHAAAAAGYRPRESDGLAWPCLQARLANLTHAELVELAMRQASESSVLLRVADVFSAERQSFPLLDLTSDVLIRCV